MYNYDPSDAALPTLIRPPYFNLNLHGLVNTASNRLMVLSAYQDTVVTLSRTAGEYVPGINKAVSGRSPLINRFLGWTWEWVFDTETRKFVHSPAPEDYELHYWIRIYAEKAIVLYTLYSWINLTRSMFNTNVVYQRDIYKKKIAEAEQLLLNQTGDFPYLMQMSNELDISLDEAANQIMIDNKNLETVLLETERIKLKYEKALIDANNIASIRALYFDFNAEKGDPSQTLLF